MKRFIFLLLICYVFSAELLTKRIKSFCSCLLAQKNRMREKEQQRLVGEAQKLLWQNPELTQEELDEKIKDIKSFPEVQECYKRSILKK